MTLQPSDLDGFGFDVTAIQFKAKKRICESAFSYSAL